MNAAVEQLAARLPRTGTPSQTQPQATSGEGLVLTTFGQLIDALEPPAATALPARTAPESQSETASDGKDSAANHVTLSFAPPPLPSPQNHLPEEPRIDGGDSKPSPQTPAASTNEQPVATVAASMREQIPAKSAGNPPPSADAQFPAQPQNAPAPRQVVPPTNGRTTSEPLPQPTPQPAEATSSITSKSSEPTTAPAPPVAASVSEQPITPKAPLAHARGYTQNPATTDNNSDPPPRLPLRNRNRNPPPSPPSRKPGRP